MWMSLFECWESLGSFKLMEAEAALLFAPSFHFCGNIDLQWMKWKQHLCRNSLHRIQPRRAIKNCSPRCIGSEAICFFHHRKSDHRRTFLIPSKSSTQSIWCIYASKPTLRFLPGVWSPDCPRCDQRILCCWWRRGVWGRGPSGCFSAECGSGPYIPNGSQAPRTHLHASAWIHSSWDPNGYESKGEIRIYFSTSIYHIYMQICCHLGWPHVHLRLFIHHHSMSLDLEAAVPPGWLRFLHEDLV